MKRLLAILVLLTVPADCLAIQHIQSPAYRMGKTTNRPSSKRGKQTTKKKTTKRKTTRKLKTHVMGYVSVPLNQKRKGSYK